MNDEQEGGVFLTASPETKSINARRIPTGEVAIRASSQSNNEGKTVPHYLRTSTGSCHDLCKYGKKHTSESKARGRTFPRYSVSGTSSGKGRNQVPSLWEKQKNSAPKMAAHPEICLYDGPKVSQERAFSPMKTVKPIQESYINKPIQESEINKHESICNKRSGLSESEIKCNIPSLSKEINPLKGFTRIKQGTLQNIGSCDDTEAIAQESPTSLKKTEAPAYSDKRKLAPHEVNLSPENASAQQRNLSAKTTFASTKPKVEQKAPSLVKKTISPGKPKTLPANRFDASAKPALPGRSNVTFVKPGSQLKPATRITGRKFETKIVKNMDLSKLHGKKSLQYPTKSLSPQSPANHVSKSASPMKHAEKFEETIGKTEEIRKKTFHEIGQGWKDSENTDSTLSKSSSCQQSPPPSSLSSSLSLSSSSSVSGHEEEEYPESESVSTEACDLVSDDGGDRKNIAAQNEDKNSHGKMAIVHSKYKDQIPYKLKFRRGKILDPDGDTRLLRFRQGRRMTDSQSGEGEIDNMNLKMKELTCEETNHPDPEGQSVVLRHQDVQDKKDSVCLFNNVIEETASKLVETRKSKVRALVGAFETVISLQERKPSAPV